MVLERLQIRYLFLVKVWLDQRPTTLPHFPIGKRHSNSHELFGVLQQSISVSEGLEVGNKHGSDILRLVRKQHIVSHEGDSKSGRNLQKQLLNRFQVPPLMCGLAETNKDVQSKQRVLLRCAPQRLASQLALEAFARLVSFKTLIGPVHQGNESRCRCESRRRPRSRYKRYIFQRVHLAMQ